MATKIKWTEELVLGLIGEARVAGRKTADEKLQQLQSAGPQFAVKDGSRTVGTMLDCCGFANLKISARGKFFQIAKKLSKDNFRLRFHCTNSYRGGGSLAIFDSTNRQEMSVNVAACRGQAQILKAYGIECTIASRID